MPYHHAEFDVQKLPQEPKTLGWFPKRVLGQMQNYTGRRFSVSELSDPERYTNEESIFLERIRAFTVPVLIGQELIAKHEADLFDQLTRLIEEKLPNATLDFRPDDLSLSRLRKYAFVHECIASPVDQATKQNMSLELFGRLTSYDTLNLRQLDHVDQFYHQRYENQVDGKDAPLEKAMIFELLAAKYQNIRFSNPGIPLYM
jgi:hypothetical protein